MELLKVAKSLWAVSLLSSFLSTWKWMKLNKAVLKKVLCGSIFEVYGRKISAWYSNLRKLHESLKNTAAVLYDTCFETALPFTNLWYVRKKVARH